jgi:hypothetical protein
MNQRQHRDDRRPTVFVSDCQDGSVDLVGILELSRAMRGRPAMFPASEKKWDSKSLASRGRLAPLGCKTPLTRYSVESVRSRLFRASRSHERDDESTTGDLGH